jgi:hypothetical protein
MKTITADSKMVAYCGLYCGACRRHLKDACPGCHENSKASWCKVRSCCIENGYLSCADCARFEDPNGCRNFNNVFSKVIGFVLRSDRAACITQIKTLGLQGHAEKMAGLGRHSIKP